MPCSSFARPPCYARARATAQRGVCTCTCQQIIEGPRLDPGPRHWLSRLASGMASAGGAQRSLQYTSKPRMGRRTAARRGRVQARRRSSVICIRDSDSGAANSSIIFIARTCFKGHVAQ